MPEEYIVRDQTGGCDDAGYRLDLLRGILDAERELEQGEGIPHDELFARLREQYRDPGLEAAVLDPD
jgi:hypothetical protein